MTGGKAGGLGARSGGGALEVSLERLVQGRRQLGGGAQPEFIAIPVQFAGRGLHAAQEGEVGGPAQGAKAA